MRLDSTVQFPYAITLGAIKDNVEWVEKMGEELGRHCRRLGVHINYAPVVDVNSNPDNPVINFRSFGGDKDNVSQKGIAFYKGINSQKIIATAKHFPGHGDTKTDSHLDLPVVNAPKKVLLQSDLYPFFKLIHEGVPGIMTAHLHVPSLDESPNMPSTLSRKTIHDLLQNQMGFEGLVFTDAMDMQGVLKHHDQGEAIVLALIAGNDIIETFLDVPKAVEAIKKALQNGRLTQSWLDFKVRKILKAKSWVGLDNYKPVRTNNLVEDLSGIQSRVINEALYANALTLFKNERGVLPLDRRSDRIVLVNINAEEDTPLAGMIKNFGNIHVVSIPLPEISRTSIDSLDQILKNAGVVLVAAHLTNMRPARNYGLTSEYISLIESMSKRENAVLLWLGNPYGLDKINWSEYKAVLCGYQNDEFTQKNIAQAVFGSIAITGQLPVSLRNVSMNSGQSTDVQNDISYGAGTMSFEKYKRLHESVDSMMSFALQESLFPGAVFQVVHKNQVVLQKAYGYPTYARGNASTAIVAKTESENTMDAVTSGINTTTKVSENNSGKVNIHDLYDLASHTNILGSALAYMRWVDEGKISVVDSLAKLFAEWNDFTIGNRTFKYCLTARSGLPAWIA